MNMKMKMKMKRSTCTRSQNNYHGHAHTTVGIQNASGSSCYISSAIQLLHRAMNEHDREALIHLSQQLKLNFGTGSKTGTGTESGSSGSSGSNGSDGEHKREIRFLIHFGNLLNQMTVRRCPSLLSSSLSSSSLSNDTNAVIGTNACSNSNYIDPSDLYQCLVSFNINSSVPGDAAASLRTLIHILRKSIEYICDTDVDVHSGSGSGNGGAGSSASVNENVNVNAK